MVGVIRTRYKAPIITEYLDTKTGEILTPGEARKSSEFWPELHFSERVLQRQAALSKLRKEVRHFAEFVLHFANKRRGITPGIQTLVNWYSVLHQRQNQHVRRYIQKLYEVGILAGDSLLGPLFQVAGTRLPAAAHLAEDAKAELRFAQMLIPQCSPIGSAPFWLEEIQREMARIVDEVMRRVKASTRSGSNWYLSYECCDFVEPESIEYV